ncbi:MAG: DUF4147 domain-containing protein [Planctomycetales bacterium]|nr:DUF4147 domain-containing protein [Planctomycetales bacterium]
MPRDARQLRSDALEIWQAGLDRVRSERLIQESVRIEDDLLWLAEEPIALHDFDRITVIGAGKAGAGMAAALEAVLGAERIRDKQVRGWVNVPADCVRPLQAIRLHAAREPGVNEPSPQGVWGTEQILALVNRLGPRDLCIGLLSGGASALLPAPAAGITLADKRTVTQFLSDAGANIGQLNTVRKQLSRVKGGRLARACKAGKFVTLIVSDVLGDPLDLIGSGPTVIDPSTPRDALEVLEAFGAREAGVDQRVFRFLSHQCAEGTRYPETVSNYIIGNNALAVDAAGIRAEQLGYSHAMIAANRLEKSAEEVGRHLAAQARQMAVGQGPDCLISGGEPIVELVPANERGLGGRNQQLVLAAAIELRAAERIALLSGGTDGEDGPTDAAGAFIDENVLQQAMDLGLDPGDFLRRNDAYHFFSPLEALLKTGPTNTNVCDLRVITVAPQT